jgi:hypothetical protein
MWKSKFPGKILFHFSIPQRLGCGKELSQGNLFSTFEYPFLPWDNIFSGSRKTKMLTRDIHLVGKQQFNDKTANCGNSA